MPRRRAINSGNQSLLLSYLAETDLVSNPRIIETKAPFAGHRGITVTVEAETQIEGQPVTLQIGLDAWFPQSLPIISLVPWNALGFIPHVETNGNVCYAQKEGLLLNRRDFKGVLDEALMRALSVLANGYRGENRWDFVDEFEAYWVKLNGVKSVLSVVTPMDGLREIIAGKKESANKEESEYIYVSDSTTSIRSYYNADDLKLYTHRNALYISLKPDTMLIPPPPNSTVGIDYFQEIVNKYLTKSELKTLSKLARKPKREEVVVFRLPRPNGGDVLFGVLFEGIEDTHPLLPGSSVRKIRPLVIQRGDKTFLLPRGGVNEALQEKRVLLFGCGSIGGFLAFDLVRSGVLDIALVDDDILLPENAFRHVLGKNKWGLAKAEALKDELQQKFPYVRPAAFLMTAQEALASGVVDPKSFDLIIVAIGDDTVSLYLNEILHNQKAAPPVLYTWLEPYGIGGHLLVTGNSDDIGCYECLFTPVSGDDNFVMGSRAAFAAPNQSFSKDISGCAGRFTPYGSQDAGRTAALASRFAVQVMLGRVNGNPIVSWKGDATEFLSAGYRLSPRYSLIEEELEKYQYGYQNKDCPVCGLAKMQ